MAILELIMAKRLNIPLKVVIGKLFGQATIKAIGMTPTAMELIQNMMINITWCMRPPKVELTQSHV